jgi:hypothetical protein
MSVITDRIRREFGVPIGINVLANAAIPALAVAQAGGGSFIRVNQWANAYIANEGIIEGAAATALRYRAALRAENIRIFADAHVKHGSHSIVADRSRFLLHVMPRGFHRIRHYGLLAASSRKASLTLARALLAVAPTTEDGLQKEPTDVLPPCPCCGGHMVIVETFARWQQPRAPPQLPPIARTIAS